MAERFGDYELVRKIAVGGMAEIYLARHASDGGGFGRPVVVKRMLPLLAVRQDFVTMFLDEARLAANLRHPNVVQVFNLGQTEGAYFMAMELVDGPHLGALFAHSLRQRKPLPIELCAYVIARGSDGLDYAHDLIDPVTGRPLSIVHRDISPQNLLVSRHGDVKVTDFGVAKASTQETKTRTGIIKGKVSYMSPEQCLGDQVDRRTDVFALGIVLYELLTRRRLFRDKSDLLVMQRITQEDVKAPSTLNPAVPADLDEIVMRALARNRDQRYASAGDLSEALDVWLAQNKHSDSRGRLGRWMEEHAVHLCVSAENEGLEAGFDIPFSDAQGPTPARRDQTVPSPVLEPIISSTSDPATEMLHIGHDDGGTLVTPAPFGHGIEATFKAPAPLPDDTRRPGAVNAKGNAAAVGGSSSVAIGALDDLPVRHGEPILEATIPDSRLDVKPPAKFPLAASIGVGVLVLLAVIGAVLIGGDDDVTAVAIKDTGGEPAFPGADPDSKNPDDDVPREKPSGDKPSGDKPSGDKPSGDKPSGDKPSGDKPEVTPADVDLVTLVVKTTPDKVPVFIGADEYLGMSPIEKKVKRAKKATVTARFDSGAESVDVNLSGPTAKVEIRARVALTLKSTPTGASVILKGPDFSEPLKTTTPISGNIKLQPGATYQVEVDASGYEREKFTLVVGNKAVEKSVTLKKEPQVRSTRPTPTRPPPPPPIDVGEGTITVFCEPWASVRVAGRNFQATPVSREKIKAGSHTLRVTRKEVGIDESIKINVPKDGAVKVVLVFEDDGKGGLKLKTRRVE